MSISNKLSWQTSGSPCNPWLVFIHGFLGCKEDWNELIAYLSPDFYCLSLDLPGHGASPFFPNFIPFLTDTLNALNQPLTVIAYSMGGRLALQIRDQLKNLTRIIYLSTNIDNTTADVEKIVTQLQMQPLSDFLQAWYAHELFCTLQPSEDFFQKRSAQDTTGLINCLRAMCPKKNPAINLTTHHEQFFLYGEKDAKYARMFKTLGLGIPGTSHAIHIEAPKLLNQYIRRIIMQSTASHETQATLWHEAGRYTDIEYHKMEGIAKITINRPEVHNAFRPLTIQEISHALHDAREDISIGAIILTGKGDKAFCSGGDQRVRAEMGYNDEQGLARLNVLDLQRQIRTCPKPVVAMVAGYAIGGGHVLHIVCDLTIASDNAIFGQTGPRVGSFDGGFGASYLARIVGQKKAREIWYLCRQYNAEEALAMGLVNTVVPYKLLESTTIAWCKEMLQHSPLALRCLKSALNADCDGQTGLQELAGNATLLFYMTAEAQEGKNAFLEKRKPDFTKFPKLP